MLTVSCLFLGDEALEGEVTRQERNTPARLHPLFRGLFRTCRRGGAPCAVLPAAGRSETRGTAVPRGGGRRRSSAARRQRDCGVAAPSHPQRDATPAPARPRPARPRHSTLTGCGSRAGRRCTARKCPSVQFEHSQLEEKKKKTKTKEERKKEKTQDNN